MKSVLDPERFDMSFFDKIPKTKVMVIGDIMIDEYLWGDVSRISPEAPVPVVNIKKSSFRLGGAANVVNNIRGLGGEVLVVGVIGADEMGQKTIQLLSEIEVKTDGLLVEKDRPTTLKTRIVAHNQQIVRYDRESLREISDTSVEKIFDYLKHQIDGLDAIIIEDYGKGVINKRLLSKILPLTQSKNKIIAVDPKISHFHLYRYATVITPNHFEAASATNLPLDSIEDLEKIGQKLLDEIACQAVLITRGEEGMSLFMKNAQSFHIPTTAKEVYDVTGAGDTVIGTLALALGAGADLRQAAVIANFAAGLVVAEVGTSAVKLDKLKKVIDQARKEME